MQSLKILSFQVANLGLEKEVRRHLASQNIDENPFLNQKNISGILKKRLFRRMRLIDKESERLHETG